MYTPKPVDTSDVVLPEQLLELTERIAENVHEVWASGRIRDGWTYGPVRDDDKKQTPCLVPYAQLSDTEKEYDRNTALETLRLITKLGYRVEKQSDGTPTPAEAALAQRIAEGYAAFGVHFGPLETVSPGPKTTRFEFRLLPESKTEKIRKLRDDVSLFLSVPTAQVTCPVPGKNTFVFEIQTGRLF